MAKNITNIIAGAPLTKRDVKRLSDHLISTRRLNEVLVMDSITTEDLRKMILVEATHRVPRMVIVRKLLGRIHSRQREEILNVFRRGF
jgi:hypothetical protein